MVQYVTVLAAFIQDWTRLYEPRIDYLKNNNTSTGCVIYSPVKVHQSTTGLKLMIHVPTMDLHDSRYN